ncbi:MAG: hypothetical protein P8R42_03870 [Candidatus Binatia bacterium]|nr:hypothetical protein [Candidatus Binatia bacterium]
MRRIGIGSLVAIMIALGVVATEPLVDRVVTVGEALAAEDPETIRKKFETFASGWMEKLRERQRFNQGKAKWSPAGGGVQTIFIGYDTANYRILPLSNVETHPIGKLVYLELKLRLVGETEDAARARQPEIIERVEVTELFRYAGGKWVY